jgi:dihydrofolate reductase
MSSLLVRNFSVSLDGFAAGADQDLEHPLGVGGEALHEWFFRTKTFKALQGETGDDTGLDDEFARKAFEKNGAWIIGRNMFGPVRGGWGDESWRGWWGENPPFHMPVFVLTHNARKSVAMDGGTTFHFVTGGIREALSRAREAAGDKNVCLGGGVSTIRQFLQEGLINELHLAIVPVLMGRGENLFAGLDLPTLGYGCTHHAASDHATHVVLSKQA